MVPDRIQHPAGTILEAGAFHFSGLGDQDVPKTPQDAPKTPQDAPKTPQDAPRRPRSHRI